MPGFDGTGPRGEGPFTGRGEGYCVMRLPRVGTDGAVVGYAGAHGAPIGSGGVSTLRPPLRLARPMPALKARPRRNWRRGRRIGAGRRRGLDARRW